MFGRFSDQEGKMKIKKLQIVGIILSAILFIAIMQIPVSNSFPMTARNTLALLAVTIIFLVTEVLPIGITCLGCTALMVVHGCTDSISTALSGYTNKVVWFVIASFGVSEALVSVPVTQRLLVFLMKKFGKNSKLLLLAIMVCSAVLSSVISSVAAAAVFIPIVMKFADICENPDDRKRLLRCYMIGLPIASSLGGMMTPAGSSVTMLVINQLEIHTGITISFVHWMMFGIPACVIMLPITWFIVTHVHRPPEIMPDKIKTYIEDISVKERFSKKELYVCLIVVIMLILWILSSWYPVLDITIVALIGTMFFFIPGFQILTWKQFEKCIGWNAFILLATMISMGSVISASGLGSWISNALFPTGISWSPYVILLFIVATTFLLMIPIPVAPALVGMLAASWCAFGNSSGLSPYIIMVAVGLTVANCNFLPLDTVPVMTYSTGSYKMFEMTKCTALNQLIMIFLIPTIVCIVGMILKIF